MRTARGKLTVLLLFLILISLTPNIPWLLPSAAVLLSLRSARSMLVRALLILPLSAMIALGAWWSGDGVVAATLLVKSYLSVLAVLAFNAVTPAQDWIAALRSWGVPGALVEVLQFVHRYLTVITDEARRMRIAATARGGFRFDAAAGALGVLFARSWARGERVHRAMLARGYNGKAL
jgi:cobalt/nickel transport system permease protein